MDSKYIIGIIIALIVGIGIGYAVLIGAVKPVTTTITVPKTVTTTSTQTLVKTTTIPTTTVTTATLVSTIVTTTTYEKTITSPTTSVTTITKPVTLTITSIVNKTVTKTLVYKVVYDALGRLITFNKTPERIVCLAPSITEIVFALGLGDKVVGVDDYSNYPQEVNELVKEGRIQRVGGYWTPDFEKIAELKPDLVLASISPHAKMLDKFRELGLNVIFLKSNTARNAYDIYQDIMLVASVFNVEDKARKLIDDIQSTIDNVIQTLVKANATPVKTLIILGPPSWGLWTTGGDTFIDYVITTSGGVNIASKYSGWVKLDYEEVLAQDPEVIIVSIMGTREDAEKIFNDIANSPLNQTTAFKNERVYVFIGEADDVLMRPGPRISTAIKILSQVLHPEVFGEINRSDVIKMSSQKTLGYELSITSIGAGDGVRIEY